VPYVESLGDRWGELCASSEVASAWADRLIDTTRPALRPDRTPGAFFHGISACLSALYRAGRHQEIIDLLRGDEIWPYKRWAVQALAAMGRGAESCRGPWTSDADVDRICEEIAAADSREAGADHDSDEELARCIEDLPVAEKNTLLLRAVRGDGAHLRAELLRRLKPDANGCATPGEGRRTVAELLAAANARREERKRLAAEQKARERARREREAAIAYEKRLDALALREDAAWQQVNTLIEARKPAEYDQAVGLLKDLRALGTRSGTVAAFDQRVRQLRERHVKKVSLLERIARAGL
jgi:hypothetical protein